MNTIEEMRYLFESMVANSNKFFAYNLWIVKKKDFFFK
jgi:hypothetical protein